MPTVLRIGPYRFFFYSNEGSEPAHIHIRGSDGEAKFWLSPVELAYNYGYRGHELKKIEELVVENRKFLIEAWNEYSERKR
jgi:hypothetical protein